MFRSLFGPDWRKSPPHLLLLSMFLEPRAPETIAVGARAGQWQDVLHEPADKAIKRFQKDGVVVEADLAGKLDFRFKVADLKDALQQRGMAVSGRKAELITRLIAADPHGAEKAVKGMTVLVCSAAGQAVAEAYRSDEKAKRDAAEQQVMSLLQGGELEKACMAMAGYEAVQVFPRGIGIDWKKYQPAGDVKVLATILKERPKILAKMSKERLAALRIAAAMAHLWGSNSSKKWLPTGYDTGIKLGPDVAARMLGFHASSKRTLAEYRSSKVVKAVQVLSASDCCPECRKINGRQFKLNEAIELPYEHCTSDMGCRCTWIAVID